MEPGAAQGGAGLQTMTCARYACTAQATTEAWKSPGVETTNNAMTVSRTSTAQPGNRSRAAGSRHKRRCGCRSIAAAGIVGAAIRTGARERTAEIAHAALDGVELIGFQRARHAL